MNLLNKFIIAGIILLILVAGCESGKGGGSSSSGGDFLVKSTIGSEGGKVATSDGKIVIDIPSGALSQNTNIIVSSTGKRGVLGDVYEFGPSGTSFAKPVNVTITYDPTLLLADAIEDDLFLVTESKDGYLETLTDITIDKVNHKITGKTSHFSEIWITHSTRVLSTNTDENGDHIPITANDIPLATGFRMPIGDPRDLSNTTIVCNDDQSLSSEDLGNDIDLLTISSYDKEPQYPKIEFNASSTSNKWIAGTAFNKDQYLTNYDTGTVGQYNDNGDFHPGEDWNRREGEDGNRPIHAISDGIILYSQRQWNTKYSTKADKTIGFGNIVVIGHKLRDGRIIASVYAHMKDLSPCSVGNKVNKGDIIGLIGTTGESTNNHLHFEIIKTNTVENASSQVWKFNTPLIDSVTKQIYIRYSEQKDKDGNTTKESGWYWPKTETVINDNYENPSAFIQTRSDTTAPSIPAGFDISSIGSNQVTLSWTLSPETDVAGYNIYRNGIFVKSVTTSPTSDADLNPSTQYCYTISSYDKAGNESAHSSPVCVITMSILADKIIFLTTRDGNWEIYSVDRDGLNPTNLTNNSADDKLPALSPDRGRIAFVSDRDGNNEIYVMDIDGNNLRRLTNNYSDDFTPAWSPDGLKIAFVSKRDENYEIYVMNADGTDQTRLTNNYSDDLFPAWSPDGTKIVFVSKRDDDNEVYVMDSDGLNQNNLSWSYADDTIPFFSPDGSKIAFVSNRSGDYDLWAMDSNGFNHRKLTGDATDTVGWYAWSPDGTRIAFDSSMDGDSEIYVVNPNGANLRQLTNNTASDRFSSWTWDGTKIVFISDRDGNDEVYLMDPDGGNPVNLSNDPSDDDLPAASPVYQEGGGCFIATVAFGSYLDPHVIVLREFRDNYLLSNVPGRAFVAFYYEYSPSAAQFIRRHENLRTVTRWVLTPVVFGVKYPHILIAFVVIITGFSVYRRKQKTRRHS